MENGDKTKLFEVRSEQRLLRPKGMKFVRTTGRQGDWREEEMLVIASDEAEARELVKAAIEEKRILGKNAFRRAECKREINILQVRRIA